MTAEARFTTITPRMAARMLEQHDDVVRASGQTSLNRILNENTVKQYETAMKEGRWIENGEAIQQVVTGRLLNGQHRLWASVNGQVAFRSLLVTGIAEKDADNAFVTIDIGRAKNAGAFLNVSGLSYGGYIAPAIRLIMCYQRHKSLTKTHMITTDEIVHYGKDNMERLVNSAAFCAKHRAHAPGSTMTAWHYLFFEKHQEEAAKFITDFSEGVGLHKGDPVHAMRERLIQNKGQKTHRLVGKSIFAMGIYMWNDRRRSVARQVIKSPQLDYSKLPKIV